jgi:hypothetical protein
MKSETQLACEIVRLLNGVSIQAARNALSHAEQLLVTTQIVKGDSPLLLVTEENNKL